ncbi:MAG: D-2-hydroxyacid dehydrogenase [Gammaproteobacteria bacterium]|nr:D-2-hydroxyacid dehydrogenase [Gammaproteobacteria bacterium]
MRIKHCLVAALAVLLGSSPSYGGLTIEELVAQSGLVEGEKAVREFESWDAKRPVILRDIGVDPAQLADLEDQGRIVLVSSVDEAMQHAANAGAVIGFCSKALMDAAPNVTWVQIFSAGAERCLASEKFATGEVLLTNMQKMSSPVIAEHAIALLLALTRNLPQFAAAMDEGNWSRGSAVTGGMTTVEGKTMLVLGLGGIGTEVARRAAALGMRVVATRNRSRQGPDFVDYVGLSDEMLTLAAEADVVVNALPLTDGTRGLVDKGFFAVLDGAYFINVGRGATVNTEELLSALQSGKVAGAGLDVTDPEPLPTKHPLWQMDNVLITPHVAGRGSDRTRHTLLLIENLRRYYDGDALYNVVDPDEGY